MAIGEGGAENPYVHSDIEHWTSGGYNISPTLIEEKDLMDSIESLKGIRKQLFDAANNFLGGQPVSVLNYDIDNNPKTYVDIAIKLIQSFAAQKALMEQEPLISKEDTKQFISNLSPTVQNKVMDLISLNEVEQVGIRSLSRAIGRACSNADLKLTIGGSELVGKLIKATDFEGDLTKGSVVKDITEVATGNIKSGKGQIVTAITNIIKKLVIKDSNSISSVDSFMTWFRSAFLKETDNIHFMDVEREPEDFLQKVESNLRALLGEAIIKDKRNATGALGDEVYVSIRQADNETIFVDYEIASTGKLTERNLAKKYGIEPMITHHSLDKSSQTDIVIKNKKGETARVQAKNSLVNGKYTIKETGKEYNLLMAHVQRDMELIALLNEMKVPNIEQITYTIANALWFSSHGSVTGVRDSGQLNFKSNGKKDPQILSALRAEINAYFGTQATNFLGITLDKGVDKAKEIIAEASNLFFLSKGIFIPTYTLVDEVIADLEAYAEGAKKFNGLNFTMVKADSISWPYTMPKKFWIEKAGEDRNFNNRVEVATTQGAAAISSIVIHGTFKGIQNYTSLTFST